MRVRKRRILPGDIAAGFADYFYVPYHGILNERALHKCRLVRANGVRLNPFNGFHDV
jgi:hypothetical protein